MVHPLRKIDFSLIYLLQMLSAVSVSIMFSLLPSVGRISGIPDALIVTTQALSAATWFFVAGYWSGLARRRGRKFVILIGSAGLLLVCISTGLGILVAVSRVVAPWIALIILVLARSANGAIGLASGPAGQAYVIERSSTERRTIMLSSLASSQAIGTVVGPAIAPFLTHFPMVGLAGPMFVMAAVTALILPLLVFVLPGDGVAAAHSQGTSAQADAAENAPTQKLWHLPRMRAYLLYASLVGIVMAGTVQAIGFLVIDTIHLPPEQAPPYVGRVIAAGALAMLIFQLVLVPLLKPSPRSLMLFAPIGGALGLCIVATLPAYPALIAAFAIANVGFAAARPGVLSAASLSLPMARQTELSSAMLSTASFGIIVGPVTSVWLYSIWQPLPYIAMTSLLVMAFVIALTCKSAPIRTAERSSGPLREK